MLCYCRYKYVLIWEDKTIDYFVSMDAKYGALSGSHCFTLAERVGRVSPHKCGELFKNLRKYLCQTRGELRKQQHERDSRPAVTGQGQHTQQLFPPASGRISLGPVSTNVSDLTFNFTGAGPQGQWRLLSCPMGHVTHTFLACDELTFCWAEDDVTFSHQSDVWAVPTSVSCPAPLDVAVLPPSFPCRSVEQRVAYSLVCDHRPDCQDDSDETFCYFPPCGPAQFACHNKQVCFDFTRGCRRVTH